MPKNIDEQGVAIINQIEKLLKELKDHISEASNIPVPGALVMDASPSALPKGSK